MADSNPSGKLSPESLLRFTTIVTSLTITAITILAALGRPTDVIMQVFLVAAGASVPVILANISGNTKDAKENTNGRISQLIDGHRDMADKMVELAKMIPPPATSDTTPEE